MSEYQRYEFLAVDRPLTRVQLAAVSALSSHIEASSTRALVEYQWGDFKHDPIRVLGDFFDGFLYWANWGSPRLALRFPHGILPGDLVDGYQLDDVVTFTRQKDYDILDMHFASLAGPDEWIDYALGSLIGIRDELMDGDLRALYIVWLADQQSGETFDEQESSEDTVPPVPPAFGKLTAAQQALADLFQVPQELLVATAEYSKAPVLAVADDIATWVTSLSAERRDAYLIRLAHNEPGLGYQLIRELRELNLGRTSLSIPTGEHVAYATLFAESKVLKARREREEQEREQVARQRHLQDVHDHQAVYWQQVEQAVTRGSGGGYDDALRGLLELRDTASHFNEIREFHLRFSTWVQPHLRRPAFVRRVQEHRFPLPE